MRNAIFASSDFMDALKTLIDKDVPVKTAYKLKKILDQVGEALTLFNSTRTKVLEKYCVKWDADDLEKNQKKGAPKIENKQYVFTPDVMDNLNKDISELLSIEFLINDRVKLDDLGDVKLPTKALVLLEELFEDFKKEEKKLEAVK